MKMGEKIKQRRLELGFSVDEVAKRLGKNRATVYRYENGNIKDLPIDVLVPLAEILETTPAELVGWGSDISEEAQYNSIEDMIASEATKLNQKGKIKLLDTAREMACNPLYNPDYQAELAAAHERTDTKVTEEARLEDDAIMHNDSEWE